MSVLTYKGYQGSVSFEDGKLVIQVLHIDDLITTECDSASSAKKEFEDLIDDYLETCEEIGRDPQKPFKGSFNIRMAPSLHKSIAMEATNSGVSLNAWVVSAIEQKLESGRIEILEYILNSSREVAAVGKGVVYDYRHGEKQKWEPSSSTRSGTLIEGISQSRSFRKPMLSPSGGMN